MSIAASEAQIPGLTSTSSRQRGNRHTPENSPTKFIRHPNLLQTHDLRSPAGLMSRSRRWALHAWRWRSVRPFACSYQEDGHWREGLELRVGIGGDIPIIYRHEWGVRKIFAPGRPVFPCFVKHQMWEVVAVFIGEIRALRHHVADSPRLNGRQFFFVYRCFDCGDDFGFGMAGQD